MQLRRNEFLTGVLVLVTVAVLTGVLVLLGTPGLFKPLVTYKIYFDNAAGIKLGAPVLLAGRKIGQVEKLYSPVSKEESQKAQAAGEAIRPPDPNASPTPPNDKAKYEARIDVRVDRDALVYKDALARLISLGLLGETAIDMTQGSEASGRAADGEAFAGERVPDFGEAIAKIITVLEPVAKEATNTMKELQSTAQNLNHLTDENSQLTLALGQFRTFGEHLVSLTAENGALTESLNHIEEISNQLTQNDNIKVTLQNFRDSSERLKSAIGSIGPDLKATGENVKDLTDTVKRQPWRLIWPSTKSYPDDQQQQRPAPAGETITVRKSTKANRPAAAQSAPSPTATPRPKRPWMIVP
jgi:ABC-type transporter Mla subunit MlaD